MKNLHALCAKNNISQSELAKRIGKSQAFISRVASGKKQPSLKTAKKIADVFNVTVSYLLGETGGDKSVKNTADTTAKENVYSKVGTNC